MKRTGDRLLDLGSQTKQARLRRHQFLLELGTPRRMGEVAGRHDRDALARRPRGQMFEIEVAAGGARIFRVDVQVGVKAHGGSALPLCGRGRKAKLRVHLIRRKTACG
jgi:hypothetical protein